MVKIQNDPKLDVNSPPKKNPNQTQKRKVNMLIKDHSWHEQLPSWMASEVLIKQSAVDIKTISGRPGIPRLTVPTPRILRI